MFNTNLTVFCSDISPFLQIAGQIIATFEIALPIILIALGIIDIGKAVISSKSEDVKKHVVNFFKRVLVCIIVFFIPTIFMVIFQLSGKFSSTIEGSGVDYDVCYDCLFRPNSENCVSSVEYSRYR